MVNLLKKLARTYQVQRLAKSRKANNSKQLKLIYNGLIERGY